MTSFYLKIIACVTMFFDHFAKICQPVIYPLVYIGRFAFPIFAFQASIGFAHTKNIYKYILRLFIFAVISQIPYSLLFNGINVIFTLLLGVISLFLYEKLIKRNLYPLAFLTVAFIGFIAQYFNMDYGCYGIFLIFLFHVTKNNKILMTLGFIVLSTFLYIQKFLTYGLNTVYIMQLLFTYLAIIPILLYNNKQGKKIKYAIYIFYPLHLFLLYLLAML